MILLICILHGFIAGILFRGFCDDYPNYNKIISVSMFLVWPLFIPIIVCSTVYGLIKDFVRSLEK